jgi:hypothetical protein
MKPYISIFLVLGLIVPALVSGCVLTASPARGDITSFLSDPPNDSVVQVGTAVNLYADTYSYIEGREITNMFFFANGGSIGEATVEHDGANHWGGYSAWTPSAIGEYSLQVMAVWRGGSYMSEPVRVCVTDFLIAPGRYTAAFGYEGPCPIPGRDSSARPGPLTFTAIATPDHIAYDPAYGDACPFPVLSFTATVTDPAEDVAFVTVALKFPIGPGTDAHYRPIAGPDWTLILTQAGTFAGDTRIFTGTAGDRFLMENVAIFFGSVGGDVTWTAQVIGRDGSILATDGPHTIPATPCSSALPTPTLIPVSTGTPEGLCPPGTYYAPVTNQCIPIQINPTKSGGPNCSQYTTDTSCNAAPGCSYDYVAKKCKSE